MLKIQNLSYAYKKIQALKDVSFSLQDGEIMSIIGANGAGKSTLMKCIAGVLKTDSGSVILDDFPLAQMNEARFSNIFIEKRASTCPQSLEKSRLFSYALLVSECENFQNMKRIFLRKVVI